MVVLGVRRGRHWESRTGVPTLEYSLSSPPGSGSRAFTRWGNCDSVGVGWGQGDG